MCCYQKRFSFSLEVVSCAISAVCQLKYPYSCLSYHFCFLVFLFYLMLLILSLEAVINLSLLFLVYSWSQNSSSQIVASTHFLILVSLPPPSFRDTFSLSVIFRVPSYQFLYYFGQFLSFLSFLEWEPHIPLMKCLLLNVVILSFPFPLFRLWRMLPIFLCTCNFLFHLNVLMLSRFGSSIPAVIFRY